MNRAVTVEAAQLWRYSLAVAIVRRRIRRECRENCDDDAEAFGVKRFLDSDQCEFNGARAPTSKLERSC